MRNLQLKKNLFKRIFFLVICSFAIISCSGSGSSNNSNNSNNSNASSDTSPDGISIIQGVRFEVIPPLVVIPDVSFDISVRVTNLSLTDTTDNVMVIIYKTDSTASPIVPADSTSVKIIIFRTLAAGDSTTVSISQNINATGIIYYGACIGDKCSGTIAINVGLIDSNNNRLIEISTREQLENMRNNPQGTSYKTSVGATGIGCGLNSDITCYGYELVADIDLAGAAWSSIGSTRFDSFATTFDGNHHTISNLTSTTNGLFSIINGGRIQNLTLDAPRVRNPSTSTNARTGALAGLAASDTTRPSQISNIRLLTAGTDTPDVQGVKNVGGLVGDGNNLKINNVFSSLVVQGTGRNIGGLIGNVSFARSAVQITNAHVTGSVRSTSTASNSRVGGLVGQVQAAFIVQSSASGAVISAGGRVGGLVGELSSFTTGINDVNVLIMGSITDSYASGAVQGTGSVGGLVGSHGGTITNSWASGFVLLNAGSGFVGTGTESIMNGYWNTETSNKIQSVGAATALTTAEMLAGSSNFVGFSDASWDFRDDNSYPVLENGISKNLQSASQVAGHIYLAVNDIASANGFLGATNVQDQLGIAITDANQVGGGGLAIFDTNAAAPNDISRADFFECTPAAVPTTTGEELFSTPAVNNATIVVKIAAGTTTPSDWLARANSDGACVIDRADGVDTTPAVGDKLNLIAEITVGDAAAAQTITRRFNISFR